MLSRLLEEMTSQLRAIKWRVASLPVSPIPQSRALWSTQALHHRALASMSRSLNEPSSPTLPCKITHTHTHTHTHTPARRHLAFIYLLSCLPGRSAAVVS